MKIDINITDLTMDSAISEIMERDDDTGEIKGVHDVTLRDLVADKIVDRMMNDEQVWPKLRDLVTDIRREIIAAKVEPTVIAALEQPIQKTNSYGDLVGAPITMRDLILEETKKVLTKSASGSSYGNSRTWLQETIQKQVEATIRADVATLAQQLKAGVQEAIGRQVAAVVVKDLGRDLSKS